jgi:hypothetical protein
VNNEVEQIWAIVAQVRPLLAGKPAEIQGGVLADCLALWLAGHQIEGDEKATATLRANLLALHMGAVQALTIVNAKQLRTEPGEPRLPIAKE